MDARPEAPTDTEKAADASVVRAFLAVELAADVRERLSALKEELAATRAQIRWVGDGGLHVTLRFLGQTPLERLEEIRRGVATHVTDLPAFSVRARGLSVFPTLRRPRVLWAGIQGSEMRDLAAHVESSLEELGIPHEKRRFEAHVTLGRVKGRRHWSRIEEALKRYASEDFGVSPVGEVTAFQSTLHPDGAVYTKLWTVPLGQTSGGGTHGS